MAENVRVAVRVRPFNSREKARNAVLIIDMKGNTTEIKDPAAPDVEPKKFTFDFSYWSHDGFNEREGDGYLEAADSRYGDQQTVFDDLGEGVLFNAWKGYNCSLFAYGQTGSGKSYSMVGYGNNKGVVPLFCEKLFVGIEGKRAEGTKDEYQVTLSMLEIYNEQVRDLLNPGSNKKGGLKVRQHPSKGFYGKSANVQPALQLEIFGVDDILQNNKNKKAKTGVESLKTVPVNSYKDIENRIEEGTKSRTVAATNMNATSSRAHTIVAINFSQKSKNEAGQNMTKTSIVNLVDLAGSERAESTGATGDRLKEGSAINQSLSTLGNCIKALADRSSGKKGVIVPFRDSVLTKMLKNALGGNSKTIMIAALSPADINYEETLSTLRFADRAKAIKTTAVVNESPTDKLIRELREENQRLMDQIKTGGVVMIPGEASPQVASGVSEEEVDEMKKEMEERLRENQEEMEQMKKSWQERMQETEASYKAKEEEERNNKEKKKTAPHFWNLNEDPQLSDMITHFIRPGTQKIGNRKADPPADITLSGLSVLAQHASVIHQKKKIKIIPCPDAKLLVNGKPIKEDTVLHHNDRVMFGSSNLFVVHHPDELAAAQKSGIRIEKVTYDMAQEEIAQQSGFDMEKTGGKSKDELMLQEDLVQMMPMVNEANAMAEELGKKVKFKIILVSPQARGLKEGPTQVKVKMNSEEDDTEWLWDRDKFRNRKFIMQEMYQNYVEGDEWDVPQDKDPFWEPDDADTYVGCVQVYLQSLAYMIELDENLAITDHKGERVGFLQVEAFPCNEKGVEDIDDFVEEPHELIGKPLHFNLKILNARGLSARFSKGETYCKYKFYLDKESEKTKRVSGTINPEFNYSHMFSYVPVTRQFIDYLLNQPLVVEVYGTQVGRKTSTAVVPQSKPAATSSGKPALANGGPQSTQSDANLRLEHQKSIRRADRADKKLKKLSGLIEEANKKNVSTIPVSAVEDILSGGDGDKFKATANVVLQTTKAAAQNDGKVTSSACVLQ